MLRVTCTLDGRVEIDRALKAVEDRARDISPAAPAVFQVFREIARNAFASEGATTAMGRWPELARTTQAQRRRLGYGAAHPILERTGTLRRSVTERTGDTIEVATERYLAIGTAVPYVVYHQSRLPRHHLPRRALVDLTEDDKHALFRPIRRHVTGHDPDAPVRGQP